VSWSASAITLFDTRALARIGVARKRARMELLREFKRKIGVFMLRLVLNVYCSSDREVDGSPHPFN
jgi:hypothetical protein